MSLTFYKHVYKMLIWWKGNCKTTFGFTKYYSMEEILIGIWGGKSGNANYWFKKFENLGFIIKKEIDRKPRYFISTKGIKGYIKKDSIFSMNLEIIDEIESVF